MSAPDYKALQHRFKQVIKDLGRPAVIQQETGTTLRTYAALSKRVDGDLDATAPQTTQLQTLEYYVPGDLRAEPVTGDDLIVDDVSYNIVNVTVYKPAKVHLAYKLEVVS